MANKDYEKIYDGMNNGIYNDVAFIIDSGKNEVVISVEKVKKACKETGINFDEFMNYAQKRKAKENEENVNEKEI